MSLCKVGVFSLVSISKIRGLTFVTSASESIEKAESRTVTLYCVVQFNLGSYHITECVFNACSSCLFNTEEISYFACTVSQFAVLHLEDINHVSLSDQQNAGT